MAEIGTYALDAFENEAVQDILEMNDWMKECEFKLLTKRQEVTDYIDACIEKGHVAVDLETDSLNTRKELKHLPTAKIVGVCLANSRNEGIYIPVKHDDTEYNVPTDFMIRELKRLINNCVCIYHNYKYDGAVLYNYGIDIKDEALYEDTLIMASIEDASRKQKGLKYLSEKLLRRPMVEIDGLGITGNTKKVVAFNMVHPRKAVYYGGSDAMNTFFLWEYFTAKINEQDPQRRAGPWAIYKVEKRCLFVTMEMERNLIHIDIPYLKDVQKEILGKCNSLLEGIYEIVGRKFDVNSPQQLGTVLFDELKIPYPSKEKTASGQYQTSQAVLEQMSTDHPVANMLMSYKKLTKIIGTYVTNLIENADENSCSKFQMNQNRADTGRFTASGGKGLYVDGYSGVNCQNIPTYNKKDPDSVDIRKALRANPGKKIVTIDYSGEELRIATNLSKEPNWLEEFINGEGDLHSITARAIYQKDVVDKEERGNGKTLNFFTVYGGGARGFAQLAKIPYETAKRMQVNFFKVNKGLQSWIKSEGVISKKRGYSKTALGRRRPLAEFYSSPDKGIQAKGDRCAVNSAVQGCLQPQERVLTNLGYIPIEEIYLMNPRDVKDLRVWTGTSWESFNVMDRGEAQFANIELSNGLTLSCDTRHEVLVVGKEGYVFKHYKDLSSEDLICTSIPEEKEFGGYPEDYSYKAKSHNGNDLLIDTEKKWNFISFLMGCITGDGNLRVDSRQSITLSFGSSKIKDLLPKIEKGIEELGLNTSGLRKMEGAKGESYQVAINSKGLVSLLEELGCVEANSREKRVPEFIFRAPLVMRKEYIRGYWSTDGSKYANNRYGFHTPNLPLLQDVQKIGWTAGISSSICRCSDSSYKLDWGDLDKLRSIVGIEKGRKRAYTPKGMLLPEFLYGEVYDLLKDKNLTNSDRSILGKIYTRKAIGLGTVVGMLHRYSCKMPLMYYSYNLAKKTEEDTVSNTYTLSVHSDLHRFDSAGIISKNTGADVIKIALYRVWKWIHSDPEREKHIRILMPIHDEIVYEITETKMEDYIPELCRIMKLDDIVDKLGWEVKFEVDAEYGDTLSITHDFKDYYTNGEYERIQKLKMAEEGYEPEEASEDTSESDNGSMEDSKKRDAIENTSEPVPHVSDKVDKEPVILDNNNTAKGSFEELNVSTSLKDEINKSRDLDISMTLEETESGEDVVDNTAINNPALKDRVDARGYFNYTLNHDLSEIAALKVGFILKTLNIYGADMFMGPACKIKLITKSGEVLMKTKKRFSVDAFVTLCLWNEI